MTRLESDDTFDGIVKINALVKNETDTVTLNVGNRLTVQSSTVLRHGVHLYRSHDYDNVTEKFTIKLKGPVQKDWEILIVFTYKGTLKNKDFVGFYVSEYTYKHNDK